MGRSWSLVISVSVDNQVNFVLCTWLTLHYVIVIFKTCVCVCVRVCVCMRVYVLMYMSLFAHVIGSLHDYETHLKVTVELAFPSTAVSQVKSLLGSLFSLIPVTTEFIFIPTCMSISCPKEKSLCTWLHDQCWTDHHCVTTQYHVCSLISELVYWVLLLLLLFSLEARSFRTTWKGVGLQTSCCWLYEFYYCNKINYTYLICI